MSGISEAANHRWTQLLVEAGDPHVAGRLLVQQFSDAAKNAREAGVPEEIWDALSPFILPESPDPLLIEAREVLGDWAEDTWGFGSRQALDYRNGVYGDDSNTRLALAALKRGMELAGKRTGDPS